MRSHTCVAGANADMTLLQTLLIDNYDSYTYNLFQLLAEVNGVEPIVLKNDSVTIQEVQRLVAEGKVHNIVISPGPGSPDNPEDIGVNMEVLQQLTDVPVLGVCLGHQALAVAAGGKVVRAPEPVHGRLSELHHTGHPLLQGIPSGLGQGFDVVRYHSLVVDAASLPSCLEAVAWTQGQHHAVVTAQSSAQAVNQPVSTNHLAQSLNDEQQQQQQQPLIMALVHKQRPHYGVQFHPESICTRYGMQLMLNFHELSSRHLACKFALPRSLSITPLPPGCAHEPHPWPSPAQQSPDRPLRLAWRCCKAVLTPQDTKGSLVLFEGLFGWQQHSFWLDSATVDRGRFSFMGAQGGPLWRCVTYTLPPPKPVHHHITAAAYTNTAHHTAHQTGACEQPSPAACQYDHTKQHSAVESPTHAVCGMLPLKNVVLQISADHVSEAGQVHVSDSTGSTVSCRVPFFTYLRQLLATHQLQLSQEAAEQLPFNFWGGLVGYLGYELKAECGGDRVHASPTPDAALLFVDRLLAIDHKTGDVYALAVYEGSGPELPASGAALQPANAASGAGAVEPLAAQQAAQDWVDGIAKKVVSLLHQQTKAAWPAEVQQAHVNGHMAASTAAPDSNGVGHTAEQQQQQHCNGTSRSTADGSQAGTGVVSARTPFRLRHNKEKYISNIGACIRCLHSGESYEVCLTTALVRQGAPHSPTLYKTLRALNPAPYAAWLNFGWQGPTICCSSPERFLRGDRGGVLEARPIKGTAARRIGHPAEDAAAAAALAASEKDRAENLMIVDLLRNDLGRVCTVGSVHVPGLMEIESYATVHQMVSTVRGVRRSDASLVDAIQAAFPAGSMTGAPKVRTMQIIDELEGGARGVYSGCIGFISLNDCFDLNVVIRTAVMHPTTTTSASQRAMTADTTQPLSTIGHKASNLHCSCNGTDSGPSVGAGQQDEAHRQLHDMSAMPAHDNQGLTWSSRSSQWEGCALDDMYVRIGAGGAIVVQSDVVDEFDEMRLKAKALLAAVGKCDSVALHGMIAGSPAELDVDNTFTP